MCGRFSLTTPFQEVEQRFNAVLPDVYHTPHYNIAPGQIIPVLSYENGEKFSLMKWGLVPHWARDPKIGYKMINARSDTLLEKPSFREPFMRRRCIIPSDGFYEWDKKGASRVPYRIELKEKLLCGYAGIFDIWKDPEGREFQTFSVITTSANSLIANIHDRMPVILEREDEHAWLDKESSKEVIQKMLHPYTVEKMKMYPVSKLVNDPRNDTREILNKV